MEGVNEGGRDGGEGGYNTISVLLILFRCQR